MRIRLSNTRLYLLLMLSFAALCAQAQTSTLNMGPLSALIEPRSDDAWTVSHDNASVVMSNQRAEGAITYYYVNPRPGEEGRREISVDIELMQASNGSLAGLLYGFRSNPKSYFMFTVGGDGSINLHMMNNGRFEQRIKTRIDGLQTKKIKLGIQENGQNISLRANNVEVSSFGNNATGRGAVGIVASHLGRYRFSNFAINLSGNSGNNTPELSAAGTPTKMKYFETVDKKLGMVVSRTPLPANWRETTDRKNFLYEGPDNILFSGAQTRAFQFTDNQQLLQMWRMQGIQNQPPMPVDQIIETLFMPSARQLKRKLVKKYPLPQLAQWTAQFRARLFTVTPVQRDVKAYGLEWKDDQGMSYITAMIVTITYAQPFSDWSVSSQYLMAPHAVFPRAKKAFIYALTNTEANDRWIAAVNQRDAQRAGRSWQAHNARMAVINARGNTARSVGNIYSEISDISHRGYLKRDSINSAGHGKSVRAISGQTIIGNHSTGEHYNVPSGSAHHWVNSNGLYVGTNNPLWDPRTDNRTNGAQWTKFEGER